MNDKPEFKFGLSSLNPESRYALTVTPTTWRDDLNGLTVKSKGWLDSCDFCVSAEGGHYCLLHSRLMKNMDIWRCSDWKQIPEPKKKT